MEELFAELAGALLEIVGELLIQSDNRKPLISERPEVDSLLSAGPL